MIHVVQDVLMDVVLNVVQRVVVNALQIAQKLVLLLVKIFVIQHVAIRVWMGAEKLVDQHALEHVMVPRMHIIP